MRIGINTGPVVLGAVGNDLRVDFKAVGNTVNLASRLERLAEPGATYVTEETYKLTESFFRFEALGERAIKGKETPAKVFRVIASNPRTTRFDVNSESGLTPFVGRARELELLLDGFERAKGGRGQAFSIIAEAGLGKSRLLYEFRKSVTNENVTFLEGKCLSYSRTEVYHPIVELLRSNFDIRETDSDQDISEKVKKVLQRLELEETATLPYLLELLSVKESGLDKIPMSPEAKKERILEALKSIVIKGSQMRPLILVIEDLHWIDKSSQEAIRYLLENISGSSVLLIFTYRPEFVQNWGGRSYHSQINLNRLSNRESLAMLAYLLGVSEIEGNLESLILERTEGVPFFIEEFIKALRDLKIIERQNEGRYVLARDAMALAIPNTIHNVIMAKVDSLPQEARAVLQAGSVIGREFNYGVIKRVTGLPEREILSHLSVLKDSELIYERGIFPQSTYIFRHALTQKVIYDSILTSRRKKLHQAAGDALEALYREKLGEHSGLLSEHYLISGDFQKGQEYCNLAKKMAEKKGAFWEAIAYAEKRLDCLEKLTQTEDAQKLVINIRTNLGLLYLQINHYESMKKVVEPIVDLAHKLGYKRGLAGVYTILGACHGNVGDFTKAVEYLEKAITLAGEAKDYTSLSVANNYLGIALAYTCEFERAARHFENTLKLNEAAKNIWGVANLKCNIAHLVFFLIGKMDEAYKMVKEALVLAEESGDIFSIGYAYTFHGAVSYGKGFPDEAVGFLFKGSEFSRKINHFATDWFANYYLGETYCLKGDFEKGSYYFNQAALAGEEGRILPNWINLAKLSEARARSMIPGEAVDLETVLGYVAMNNVKLWDGLVCRNVAEVLLNIDDRHLTEAEEWLKKAIEADTRNGVRFYLAQDHLAYAELWKRKGDLAKTRESLTTAIEIFRSCGAEGWQQRTEKELAGL